jgi:Cell Wall Hydrolase
LKPWVLAAGLLVSFTATAGIRTIVDPSTPGLRFDDDPVNVSLAWPTLTAPDIAATAEDFITARPPFLPMPSEEESEVEPQFQTGFWRGAQPVTGSLLNDNVDRTGTSDEELSEATPEISVLFRLDSRIMPASGVFLSGPLSALDSAPVTGAFSGLLETRGVLVKLPEPVAALLPAKSAILPVTTSLPASKLPPVAEKSGSDKTQVAALAPVKIALPPVRPVAPRSPLVGIVKDAKELKCLAEAVYFESRSEPERGQAGVAQVVLNRTQSGVYPKSVCGVVYQNRHRYLACQFTFACEGKSLRITEHGSWSTAMRVARDVAEGRTYLQGVGNATHYHANYVRPWWVRHMDKREKVGKHIFYFEEPEL